MEILAIVSAAVAVVAAVISFFLLLETRRTADATEDEAAAALKSAQAAESAARTAEEALRLEREQDQRAVSKEVTDRRPRVVPDSQRTSPGAFNLHETEPRQLNAWFRNEGPTHARLTKAYLFLASDRQEGQFRDGNDIMDALVLGVGETGQVAFASSGQLDAMIRKPERMEIDLQFAPTTHREERWCLTVDLAPKLSDGGRKQWQADDYRYRLHKS
jgi:hypothetical protein